MPFRRTPWMNGGTTPFGGGMPHGGAMPFGGAPFMGGGMRPFGAGASPFGGGMPWGGGAFPLGGAMPFGGGATPFGGALPFRGGMFPLGGQPGRGGAMPFMGGAWTGPGAGASGSTEKSDAKPAPAGPFDLGALLGGASPMPGHAPAGVSILMVARTADADKDGTLSAAEWSAWLETLETDEEGAIAKAQFEKLFPPQMAGFASMMAKSLFDHDRDGALERSDFEAAFKEADKDGDGDVVLEDLMPASPFGFVPGK
jgi:hypothetical protein